MTIRLAALTVLLTTLASAAESSALFHAIRQGLHAEAKSLIEAGADVNAPRADGVTPLIQAVLTSDAQMVALLLAQGASVKAKTEFGVTALHAAAYHLEKTRLLLAAGADPNAASSNGTTPLFSAVVRAGAGKIVEELIRAGGQVTLARKGTSSSTSVLRPPRPRAI